MGSALRGAFHYEKTDCRKNITGEKSCPIRVTFRALVYNVGLGLFLLFPRDIDGLTEPSGHQAGVTDSAGRRIKPREPQVKGGLKES